MAKARPTQVIVHRIELQEKEREFLEGYADAKKAQETIKTIAMAGGVVAVGFGIYAVWWTLDSIYDFGKKAKDWLDISVDSDSPLKTVTPAWWETGFTVLKNLF